MSEDITPTTVWRGFGRWFGTGLGLACIGLALLTLLTVGGWQLGWWFTSQNTTRQAHLIRNGYSNQQSLREQVTTQIGNVYTITSQIAAHPEQANTLKPQRMAIAGMVCQDASEVTGDPLPASQAQWVTANCEAGNVRPGSPYYQAGTP